MSTNMAPQNLNEAVDATIAYIEDPDADIPQLYECLKGPDFPTAGIVHGTLGIVDSFRDGRGKVMVRGAYSLENGERRIVFTEIPYMVNKAELAQEIARLIGEKKIEGVSDLRDESSREGIRLVVELKRDAVADVVVKQLFQHTYLQSTFGIINLALVKQRPETLGVRRLLSIFVEHRVAMVTLRTILQLRKAEERMHVLEGLLIALDNLDAAIALIRAAADPPTAQSGLMSRFTLTEIQAKAILDLKLQKLTALEREGIKKEHQELREKVKELVAILGSRERILGIIKGELLAIREKFGDDRRTRIEEGAADLDIEDLIPRQEVVVMATAQGYCKRMPLSDFGTLGRAQRGMETKEGDHVSQVFVTNTHDYILVFTDHGRCHWIKGYRIPEGTGASRGRAIVNLLPRLGANATVAPAPVEDEAEGPEASPESAQPTNGAEATITPEGERVLAMIPVKEFSSTSYVVFATRQGVVKRTPLEAFSRPREGGIVALDMREGDELVEVQVSDGDSYVVMGTARGMGNLFHEKDVRELGRYAIGVKGIRLDEGDTVVSMDIVKEDANLATVLETGIVKLVSVRDQFLSSGKRARYGEGDAIVRVTEATGKVVSVLEARPGTDLLLCTRRGAIRRVPVASVNDRAAFAAGVPAMRLDAGDGVSAVERLPGEEGEQAKAVVDKEALALVESQVPEEDVLLLITGSGYAKRVSMGEFQLQGRAGKGSAIHEVSSDPIAKTFVIGTRDSILVFTKKGKCFSLRGWHFPEAGPTGKGVGLRTLLPRTDEDDSIAAFASVPSFDEGRFVFMVTKKGTVKRTHLPEFQNVTEAGLIAINLREGDEVLDAQITTGKKEILLTSLNGQAVRFDEEEAREIGRATQGVNGMDLREGDEVVSLTALPHVPEGATEAPLVLTTTQKGLGKVTKITEYRKISRGGSGVKSVSNVEKAGRIVKVIHVSRDMQILVVTRAGMSIRIPVAEISEMGRASMGVRMIKLDEGDEVAGVERYYSET
jgi:DNA gyrase subunit A